MDYKKIIKSRSTRQKILSFLSFIPDEIMLRIQYRMKTGHKLNLKDPKRYTEKIQWYKLYDKNPLMVKCVDKYDVRDYVKSKGLEKILIPCHGVFETAKDIDWSRLPCQFVMKDTLGGGGNSVIVVRDLYSENIEDLSRRANLWASKDIKKKNSGREWPYYSGKRHRIIIEDFIKSSDENTGLVDYKFLCFNGEPSLLYILSERKMGRDASCGLFDIGFNKLDVEELDERPLSTTIAKPKNYERMVEIARILSKDFSEARIDLYNVDGVIYFGEITFYDSSGYMLFNPDEFDIELGQKWKIK